MVRWIKKKELPQITRVNYKKMSLIQLKELITEIYEAKKVYDGKCRQKQGFRESMEQFVYLFFKQRFGLNNIVIEWVLGLTESVRSFCRQDSDVALFALILRNEIDEEFSEIQGQIKGTIDEVLMSLVEARQPNKGRKQLNAQFASLKEGSISLAFGLEIVGTMYPEEHPNRDEIVRKLRGKVEAGEHKGVVFSGLMKIILDMQLKTHYGFLRNLSSRFRAFDDQNYGYITRGDFEGLLDEFLEQVEHEIDFGGMMSQRASYEPGVVTFSDAVSLFSSHHVESEGEQITLLQFIFEQGQEFED